MTGTAEQAAAVSRAPSPTQEPGESLRTRRRARPPRSALDRRRERWFYLLILPWLVGLLLFQAGPVLAAFALSFAEWPLPNPPEWVGLEHLRTLWSDRVFRRTLLNTAYYAAGTVPPSIAIGLGLALLLRHRRRGVGLFRTVFFLPVVVSGVAMALLWGWVFNPRFGLLNVSLSRIGIDGPAWLQQEAWAMPALIIMGVWGVGVNMVVYLAALNSVPAELHEAAAIDGAGRWSRFRNVTLPLVSPVTLYLSIVGFIAAFQVFTPAFILTEGGPNNATLTLPLYIYFQAFRFGNLGYASALSVMLFAFVMLLTMAQLLLARRWVFYLGDR